MRAIIGSAIGVLAIGLILIGAGLRGTAATSPSAFVPTATTAPGGASAIPVNDASARTAAAGPVMVNCAPGQRALVRQVLLSGEPVSQVACVADPSAGFVADTVGAAPVAQRVSYQAAPSRTLTERRVVYQQPAPRRVEQPKRSWTKRALVIGGSTAAGAGIGGLIGGKKGALIGAALGGGGSTIWEATKK